MTKITFLGTGSAMVTERYNTCFLIEEERCSLLVDCGGGHEILRQFKKNKVSIEKTDAIFVSHSHADHILGFPFIFREMIRQQKKIVLLCSKQVAQEIDTLIHMDLREIADQNKKLLELHYIDVNTNYKNYHFFPVDERQYGFLLSGEERIAFTGDSPTTNKCLEIIQNCDVLIHEAFCSEKEKEKITGVHSTVEEAINIYRKTTAQKLIFIHTMTELEEYGSDNIKVVHDGEVITF